MTGYDETVASLENMLTRSPDHNHHRPHRPNRPHRPHRQLGSNNVKLAPSAAAAAALVLLALTACSAASPDADPTPTVSDSAAADGACTDAEVTVVVEFGSLGAPDIEECAPAGPAADALAAVDISTEGTADYGDQVVCRVDEQPAPEVESCATLPANAYWALWVRDDAEAEWAYAEEGVATLELAAGQSLGLVYTEGTDSVPPSD